MRIGKNELLDGMELQLAIAEHPISSIEALALATAETLQEIVDEFDRKLDDLKSEMADLTRYDVGTK